MRELPEIDGNQAYSATPRPSKTTPKKERHDEWDSRDSDNKWHKSKALPWLKNKPWRL
jgi:hypothetical protein